MCERERACLVVFKKEMLVMIVRENDRAKFEESVDMRSDDAGEREKGGDLT